MKTIKRKDIKVAVWLLTPALLLILIAAWQRKMPIMPQEKDLVGVWKFEEKGAVGYMYLTTNGRCYMSFPPPSSEDNGRWHFFNESDYQLRFDTIKYINGRSFIITDGLKVAEPIDPRSSSSQTKESYSKITKWEPHARIMQIETDIDASPKRFARTFVKVRDSDFPDKKHIP